MTASSSPLFRPLDDAEVARFEQWARDHYQPGDYIDPVWHPVVQQECRAIMAAVVARPMQVYRFHRSKTGEDYLWFVSRMLIDAEAGRFGPPLRLPMHIVPRPGEKEYRNVSRALIDQIKADPARLDSPILMVADDDSTPDKASILCAVDGNHRLIARLELDLPDFDTFLTPPLAERRYRITGRMQQTIRTLHPEIWQL